MPELTSPSVRIVEFGSYQFDLDTLRLSEDGRHIPAQPKALETLRVLVRNHTRVVSKEEILAVVWHDTVVEEANLSQQIFTLRRLFGDDSERPRFIATLPRRGYRFIADVREVANGNLAHSGAGAPSLGPTSRRRFTTAAIAVCALSLLLTARLGPARFGRERVVTFSVELPEGVTLMPEFNLAGVSGDGRQVAVIAAGPDEHQRIWLRAFDSPVAHPLSGTEGAVSPFWSPDSRELGFFARGKLWAVSAAGGPPRVICAAQDARGASWSPRGVIVFAQGSRSAIARVPARGGRPETVTTLDASRRDVSHRFPKFLPDGRRFLFLLWSGEVDRQGIYVGSIDGDPPRRVLPDLSPAVWSAGSLLFVRNEMLVADRMDPETLTLEYEPQVVVDRLGRKASDAAAFAASPDGDILFVRGRIQTRLESFDRQGRRIADMGSAAQWGEPAVSPDGRRVAFELRDRAAGNENLDIWIAGIPDEKRTRVTLDAAIDVLPVWSPDGAQLLFRSNRSGFSDLYRKRLDAAGVEELVLASETRKDPTDWSPDGTSILFTQYATNGPGSIWIYPLKRGAVPQPLVSGPAPARNARFSPDGRFIAYESDENGRTEIVVQSLGPDRRRWQVSSNGGQEPQWRRDGREVFFVSNEGIHAVDVLPDATGLTFGAPHLLFRARVVAWLRNGMSVSPDGQHFFISVDDSDPPSPAMVMLNWHP
jgi:Tol biopolymer transport system component/DNA-binding winged helix-turn-helix (wHTH) protein